MFDEHAINVAYEAMLDRAWEQYNEEGPEEEHDPYAVADELYAERRDREY